MFLSFKKQRWFRHYFADPPYAGSKDFEKIVLLIFEKIA
jgi:hypothetical protein